MKKKNIVILALLLISSIYNNVNAETGINDISEKDFSLKDYKEKAVVGENHVLSIGYSGKEILSKSDISYRVVGNDTDVANFNRCVDVKYKLVDNNIVFTGDVVEWGVYSVDIVPVVASTELKQWAWWNSSWQYFKHGEFINKIDNFQSMINVTNMTGGDVNCSGHANDNFSDLRFVYADNATLIPYAFDYKLNGSFVHVWLNNTENLTDFNMYYGNSFVGTTENPWVTFDWFSDVNNITDWQSTGAGVVVSVAPPLEGHDLIGIQQTYKTTAHYVHNDLFTYAGMPFIWETKFLSVDLEGAYNRMIYAVRDTGTPIHWSWIPTPGNTDCISVMNGAAAEVLYDGMGNVLYIATSTINLTGDKWSNILYETKYNSALGSRSWDKDINDGSSLDQVYITDGTGGNGEYEFYVMYSRTRKYAVTPQTIGNWNGEVEQPSGGNVTNYPPSVSFPIGNSTQCPCCPNICINVADNDSSSMNVTWFTNYTGGNVSFTRLHNVPNGSYCGVFSNFTTLAYNSIFWMEIRVDDGNSTTWYHNYYITFDNYSNCNTTTGSGSGNTLYINQYDRVGIIGIIGVFGILALFIKRRRNNGI